MMPTEFSAQWKAVKKIQERLWFLCPSQYYRQEDVPPSVKSEVKLCLIFQHRNSSIYSGKKEGRTCSLKFWGVHHALLQQLEDKESSPTGMGMNVWNHLT